MLFSSFDKQLASTSKEQARPAYSLISDSPSDNQYTNQKTNIREGNNC